MKGKGLEKLIRLASITLLLGSQMLPPVVTVLAQTSDNQTEQVATGEEWPQEQGQTHQGKNEDEIGQEKSAEVSQDSETSSLSSETENLQNNSSVTEASQDSLSEAIEDSESELPQAVRMSTQTITVGAEKNSIALDSNNDRLKTPMDFAIGKMGQLEFSVRFQFTPRDIPDVQRQKVAAEITIPAGFTVVNIPSIGGVTFSQKNNPDGSTTVIGEATDLAQSVVGQLRLRQNVKTLLENLPNTKGTYAIDLRLFAQYKTPEQITVITAGSPDETLGRLTLQGDVTKPKFSIESTSNDHPEWTPDQVSQSESGRSFDHGLSANGVGASDHLGIAFGPAPDLRGDSTKNKPFVVKYHKSEGFLLNGLSFKMPLPAENEKFLTDKGVMMWRFVTDKGVKTPLQNWHFWYWRSFSQNLSTDSNVLTLNLSNDADKVTGNDFTEAVKDSKLSYADLYHEAGTFELYYSPATYINKLYEGDWNQTSYVAQAAPHVTLKNPEDGTEETVTGTDPLTFKLIQGKEAPKLYVERDLSKDDQGNVPKEIPQYTSESPRYGDSSELRAWATFVNRTASGGFQIQDDLSVSYSFEEALSPVRISDLETTKGKGMSYRIYVTDAKTGNLAKITTIVDEESAPTYQAQTINGVQETLINGTGITEWSFDEANLPNNSLFISKVEAFKKEYEFNTAGIDGNDWFKMTLRAYHHKLSDASNIPTDYPAKIERVITSKQLQTPLKKTITIHTIEKQDDIKVSAYNYLKPTEINTHPDINSFAILFINKYIKTQDYNVNPATGKAYVFGEAEYDPAVAVIEGTAVTMFDHLDKTENNRLLGIWGDDGNYYKLADHGIHADDYLVDFVSYYSSTKKNLYKSSNDTASLNPSMSTQVYELKKIYDRLGIRFATKIVIGLDNINEIDTSTGPVTRSIHAYNQYLKPGYLNYDALYGSKDLTNSSSQEATYKVYTWNSYSQFDKEMVQKETLDPATMGIKHGLNNGLDGKGPAVTLGEKAEKLSIAQYDHYLNPFISVSDNRNNVLGESFPEGLTQDELKVDDVQQIYDYGTPVAQLSKVNITQKISDNVPIMEYKNMVMDFSGTDTKLLSLVNAVHLPSTRQYHWKLSIQYTLSDGRTLELKDPSTQGTTRSYILLPEVDIANGIYVTDLKLTFPNEINWGNNVGRASKNIRAGTNEAIPEVGLALVDQRVPSKYPGTDITIGSISDQDNDATYDKLKVKARLRFTDIFDRDLTSDKSKYEAEGSSARIKGASAQIPELIHHTNYRTTSTNQGGTVTVSSQLWYVSDNTGLTLFKSKVKPKAVYYYKINKNFTYEEGSSRLLPEGAVLTFYPAGQGVGKSGFTDYGILKLSLEEAKEDTIPFESTGGDLVRSRLTHEFKLRVRYNAPTINANPIEGAWLDFPIDANRNGKLGNAQNILIETTDGKGQLKDTGPMGTIYGNSDTAKDTNNDGKAEMLYVAIDVPHKIQEQAIQGAIPYVISTSPHNESLTRVSSKDLTKVENLFSQRVYITGDDTIYTKDWEIYVPITKKGEQYSYHFAAEDLKSEKNDFGMDYLEMDTEDLKEKSLDYEILYTTDPNPAQNGYSGAKAANWSATIPDDLSKITMVKVKVNQLIAKEKAYFDIKFKLDNHKTTIGEQTNYTVGYANYKVGDNSELAFGEKGQNFKPQAFVLEDQAISGFVWNEADYNSTYNKNDDKLVNSVTMKLFDKNGVEVKQTDAAQYKNNRKFITDGNGRYTLIVPHDGDWDVRIELPSGKGMTKKEANNNPSIDSAFDRHTKVASVHFTGDPVRANYELKNINAGIYDAPYFTFDKNQLIHILDQTKAVKGTIHNPAPNHTVIIQNSSTAPMDIVAIQDRGDSSATIHPKNTGKTQLVFKTDDGYQEFIEQSIEITIYNKVTYHANTGQGTLTPNSENYYPSSNPDGSDARTDEAVLKEHTGFSKTGYRFDSWNTQADGQGTVYQPNAIYKIGKQSNDVILYAQWQPTNYVVKFDKNAITIDGEALDQLPSGTMPDQTMTYDSKSALTANAYHVTGYDFVGWNTQADGQGTTYADQAEVLNLSDKADGVVTLYAQWKLHDYTVIFKDAADANPGHENEILKVQTVPYKKAAVAPVAPENKTGYEFAAWDKEFSEITSDLEVVATYKPITYKVVYNGNAALITGNMGASTHTYDKEQELSPNTFKYAGYNFRGWATTPDGAVTYQDGEAVLNLTSIKNKEIHLYAVWEAATPVTDNLTVTKQVVGDKAVTDHVFAFTLEAIGTTAAGVTDMPMPNQSKNAATVQITGSGHQQFGQIHFAIPGTYTYQVKEVDDRAMHYTYDRSVFVISYVVTQEGEDLALERVIHKNGQVVPDILFTNSLSLPVYDVVFDAAGGQTTPPVQHIKEGYQATPPDTISRPGYVFKHWTLDNQPYDFATPVTSSLLLKAVWEPVAPTKDDLVVKKVIKGQKPSEETHFTFELEAISTTADEPLAMPMLENLIGTKGFATVTGEGETTFGAIRFTMPGTYIYKIREQDTQERGYTYDTTEYTVTYEVTQKGDKLALKRTITKDNHVLTTDEVPTFYNHYIPQETSLVFQARKQLISPSGKVRTLSADAFTFELTDEKGHRVASTKNTATGEVVFPTQTFTRAGTYIYTITERTGTANGITYDDTKHKATVTVTDVQGILQATVAYDQHQMPIFQNKAAEIEVAGQIEWDDIEDQDGKRPNTVTIQLYANKQLVAGQVLQTRMGDDWKYRFADLPKYDDQGQKIHYSIALAHEVSDYTVEQGKGQYDLKLIHRPEQREILVEKIWDDESNQDGKRPSEITVKIFKNGDKTTPIGTRTLTADHQGKWLARFQDLPAYEKGKWITYTVVEEAVAGYTSQVDDTNPNHILITNTHTPSVIRIQGKKIWKDGNNQDGKRPESITVYLLADGQRIQSQLVTADVNGKWTYQFTNLAKFKDGTEIHYSVEEETVADYVTTIKGFDIINQYTPVTTETTTTESTTTEETTTTGSATTETPTSEESVTTESTTEEPLTTRSEEALPPSKNKNGSRRVLPKTGTQFSPTWSILGLVGLGVVVVVRKKAKK